MQEFEQSELERREKEQEKLSVHESLVDREIRQQLEREAEVARSRSIPSPASPGAGPHHSPAMEHSQPSYAHAGESLIARELREQREREEELRQRWNDMGMEMPPLSDVPETPFQIPQPTVQPTVVHSSKGGPNGVAATNGLSADSDASSVSSAQESHIQQLKAAPVESARQKVRPFEDPEDSAEPPGFRYIPQNETPIDREIRLMREREEALRQSRGLPAKVETDEPPVEVEVDISPSRPQHLYRKGEEEVGRSTMKRLAHSNIQREIAREKQKESDLQQLGRIKTLSMDQVDKTPKYTDVIPKEALEGPPPSLKTPTPTKTKGFYTPTTPVAVQGHAPFPSATAEVSTVNSPLLQDDTDSHDRPLTPKGRSVVNRYSSHLSQEDDSGKQRSLTSAESRIDMELRELKAREEELR